MQRVLVILTVILLVTVSLGVGALTADWPFWRRAWAWHVADGGWPSALPGPHAALSGGGGAPLRFEAASAELAAAAGKARTQLLLRARDGQADAWFAAPDSAGHTLIDGRGLTAVVLIALFDVLALKHPGLLDRPVGAFLDELRQDQRGALTPRALLAQVGHGFDAPPARTPLNPFSAAARLVSGPDFREAALAAFDPVDAARGTAPAAAAQLLASVAATVEGENFAAVLEREFWSAAATADATLPLDRRRGTAAAHCCLQAAATDWLRLGLAVAATGAPYDAVRTFTTAGRILVVGASGQAVFWAGEGAPPSGLEMLLAGP
ncbi:MAG TPA: hypothetical protein VMK82_03480 [Steroidobacteraceae bacterium]|nr:hypothetical protein [Steroidobacteraceae bacterium]